MPEKELIQFNKYIDKRIVAEDALGLCSSDGCKKKEDK